MRVKLFLVLFMSAESFVLGSLWYPQHMFCLRNKKNNFQLHILIWHLNICKSIDANSDDPAHYTFFFEEASKRFRKQKNQKTSAEFINP